MNALILAKMQTFKPDSLKTSGDIAPQNQRILQTIISSVALNVSPLSLVRFLILRRSFQQWQWIFADWTCKKIEKKTERVYFELIGSQERSLSSVTEQHKRDTRVKIAALIDYLENMISV